MKSRLNKKVGIITLPLKGNYGGVLQAFALLTFLKNEGFDAYLVDRQWDAREKKTMIYYIQKFIFHNIIRRKVMNFCEEWINPKTLKIDTQEKMKTLNKQGFDAFVVGSDQVWRLEHIGGVKNNYFLDFIDNPKVKKLAYAASFGKDSVDGTSEKIAEVSKLLQQFNAISVRENSGLSICRDVFNIDNVEHVVDPVLLVDSSVFLPIINKNDKPLSQKVIVYVLDKKAENLEIISKVSSKLNLEVQSINYKKDPALLLKNKALDIHNYIYPSVPNWLKGFRDAEFVVTDSFHGMMFSVAFKKQFIVIGNERRGLARFSSFLEKMGLLNRLITSTNKYNERMVDDKIDYNEVYKILEKEKSKSRKFLLDSLK